VNGQHYRDFLLSEQLLPAIRHIAGDVYTFQQDSAPAHRARETIELLQRETPDFITPDLWPPNSSDLNPVDYRIWGILQERVYRKSVKDVDELTLRLSEAWSGIQQAALIRRFINDEFVLMHVSMPKENTLNTCYEVLHHNS
jgi:DDE superfamily endonuclease